jgi:autotransporter family porin
MMHQHNFQRWLWVFFSMAVLVQCASFRLSPPPAFGTMSNTSFTASGTAAPTSLIQGQTLTITGTFTAKQALSNVNVDLEIRSTTHAKLLQKYYLGQSFAAGQTKTYTWTLVIPSTLAPATYNVVVAVFNSSWSTAYIWYEPATTFQVVSGGGGSGYFGTLPPGSTLPNDCASRVRPAAERRPENDAANHTIGITGVHVDGASAEFMSRLGSRIDGSFTGTTDEILQWGACKWGLDEDMQRARAVQESAWRQSQRGDSTTSASLCALLSKSAPCYQSYGLLQIKGTVHEGTYPTSQLSTPFNVDYALAWQRACFEGDFTWLGGTYRAGDLWGCVGAWFSGSWYDAGAQDYINQVKTHLLNRTWESY